jgi:hypothetical protein
MKRIFFSISLCIAAMTAMHAQQISVVAPGGTTTLYTDLNLAIQGAASGSTVYLSGGGFQINDSSKITKKLTIIGIGHRPDNDNADGNTIVSGNFFFNGGSDNSALMGVYLSGNVNIGTSANVVNNILVRYCNVNAISVGNSNCQGVVINQNYLRGGSSGGSSAISFTNNILYSLQYITGGIIDHNVFVYNAEYGGYSGTVSNSQIKNNIFLKSTSGGSVVSNNMLTGTWGDNCVTVTDWNDVLVGPNNGVNPTSDFHLKGTLGKNAATDGTDIGIYGGTGFSDTALPPVPRIVSKSVPEQTDENGKLNIQVRIKAQ